MDSDGRLELRAASEPGRNIGTSVACSNDVADPSRKGRKLYCTRKGNRFVSGLTSGFEFPGAFNVFQGRYPSKYEMKMFAKDGTKIRLRPIKPEDAPMLVDLFNSLSPSSVFFRFLRHLKCLPPAMLDHFTRIDYDHNVAMVALHRTDTGERMVGVCRVMRPYGSTKGEIAVVVADEWQGKGIGAKLMEVCIQISRELGMKSLWGLVSSRNTTIIALADKLGFTLKQDPEADTFEIEIELD